MKTLKIKRYRLGVSRTFPAKHPKAGKSTFFVSQIRHATCKHLDIDGKKIGRCCDNCDNEFECAITKKIHTIRANYPLWEKRMKEVQAGNAVIELFYWSGNPYRSPQVVFATLDKDSGCGVQMLEFEEMIMTDSLVLTTKRKGTLRLFRTKTKIELSGLAKNDGLSYQDFKDWFKGYDLSEPMAIIHFTKFRY